LSANRTDEYSTKEIMGSTTPQPVTADSTPYQYWIPVLAAGSAFFMIVLDTSIVNLALAKIGSDFQSGLAALQWLVDGYAMIFASLLLGAGALGDRLGVKGTFMAGLALFTAASAACGFAPSIDALQVARIAQGIGAAMLLPNSLAALNHTFTDPYQRAKAIASWASAGALGVAVGPVLGGFLVQTLGWRSIFVVNVPFGILALWMTQCHIPSATRHPSRPLDLLGQIFAVGTLASATYALISMGHAASSTKEVAASSLAFVLFGLGFVFIEARQESPMLPLRLLRVRTLGPVAFVGLLHNVSIYGMIFVLSLYFQRLIGLTPMKAGLLFLPMTLALAIGTRLGAKILRSRGAFTPLIWGHLAAGVGALLLALVGHFFGAAMLVFPLLAIGLGAGVTTPAMSLSVLDSVERSQSGLASGILNSARQAGGVIGVAVLGALLGDPANLLGAQRAEYLAAIVLCTASALALIASREHSPA
jgi:MFS transporter, DHA2 family, methylenomycin A resistance protein